MNQKKIPEISIQFETVEIQAGPRKLKETWTCELGPDIWAFGTSETKWEKFCNWLKRLFIKRAI